MIIPQTKVVAHSPFSHIGYEALFIAGDTLYTPLRTSGSLFFRAVRLSLQEDVHGRVNSLAGEILLRFGKLLCALICFGIGLPLALIALPIHWIAHQGKPDLTQLKPEEHPPHQRPDSFTFTTFNVAALPDYIGAFNCLPPLSQRIKRLAHYILNSGAHAICLQELCDPRAIRTLISCCKQKYPHILIDVAPRVEGQSSGLAIFSTLPIEQARFWQYTKAAGMDALANKGILGAKIRLDQETHINLFTTHLQAGAGKKNEAIRKEQLDELETVMSVTADQDYESAASIIAGDFNISKYAESHDHALSSEWDERQDFFSQYIQPDQLSLEDGSFWHCHSPKTCWDYATKDQWQKLKFQPDHILLSKRVRKIQPSITAFIDAAGDCSDHLPITATLPLSVQG